jgi:hypothetical protein
VFCELLSVPAALLLSEAAKDASCFVGSIGAWRALIPVGCSGVHAWRRTGTTLGLASTRDQGLSRTASAGAPDGLKFAHAAGSPVW